MKTIVPLLLVAACLVSCSQPKPEPRAQAKYSSVDLASEPAAVPAPETATSPTAAPGSSVTTTVTTSETHPATTEAPANATVTKETAVTTTPVVGTNHATGIATMGNTTAVAQTGGVVSPTSPFGRPAQPAVPATTAPPLTTPGGAPVAGMITPSAASSNSPPEALLPELSVNFHAAPIDLVLQTYADFVHKILLRSPNIPTTTAVTFVQQVPVTKTEMIHALDAQLAMYNIAMIPTGDKFIKVVPVSEVNGNGMQINDMNASVLPEFGPFDTHIVQLHYTKPTAIAAILQSFTKTPAAVLPLDDSGMLVLRDTAENIRVMMDMINRLDTTVESDIVSEVIPIKYALAADIADALNSVSGTGGGTSFGSRPGSGATGSLGTSRSTGPGNARGIGGGINGGGFGGGYNGGGVSPQAGIGGNTLGGGSTLGGASPSFTDRVKSLIDRAAGGGKNGEFQILGQTKIIADVRQNALLVFATKPDMERIKDIVKKLDVVLAQVLIEAVIMEVTLDNTKTLGVSAAQHPQGNNNVFLGGYNNGQQFFPFLPSQQSGSNSFPGNFTSTLTPNMFSYWGKFGNNLDVALQAAQTDSRVNVLSRPRIQTSHGVEADLFVGSTIPYVDSTTAGAFGGTGVYNSYQQQQVGITLKVKPLINPDGLVVMDIYQEASVQGPPSTAVNINGTSVPTINQRQASATVAVKDRDTIILGGMISTSQTKTKSGVPYLKDIPLLGNIFRSNANTEERVELIVLIRPTVLPTPEAAAAVANIERQKLPGVRAAENEIHEQEAVRLKQAEEDEKRMLMDTNRVHTPMDY
jgi:type II secretory pathway component GspD/PulD (secretin)